MPGRNGLCGAIAADVPAVTIDTLLHFPRHQGEGTENHIRFNTAIGSHAWTLFSTPILTM